MTPLAVALLAWTVGFAAYHPLDARFNRPEATPRQHHLRRLAGALLLGVFPTALTVALTDLGPADLGLGVPTGTLAWLWVLGTWVLAAPLLWLAAGGEAHRAAYPQVRRSDWSPTDHVANALSWAVYLFGYELGFRGLLLYAALGPLGPAGAIALNLALYVAAHAHKGSAEVAACIPMGALFCAVTLDAAAIWPAWMLHLGISLLGEGMALARR